MLFRPNLKAVVTPTDGHDVYGAEKMGEPWEADIALIRLVNMAEPTSVRTDSSASRAYAKEYTSDARLLFTPESRVKQGDKVDVLGYCLRVKSVFPRVAMEGVIDHWQVDLEIW